MKILTNYTKRAFPNLKIGLKHIRVSNFTEFYNSDLKEIINNLLGKIYFQDDTFVIFFYAKNAFNSSYELFLNCFPTNIFLSTHSVDDLNYHYRNIFFKGLENSQISIKEYAIKNKKKLLRIYSYQHIGENELNSFKFKTTYPQTHWHVYAVDEETLNNCKFIEHKEFCYLNTFNEFFIELYAEILGSGVSSIDYNTHSIILKEKRLSLTFNNNDKKLICNVLTEWKVIWKEIASCYTNFEISQQGRFELYSTDETITNLNNLFDKISLSINTKKRLLWLSKNINKEAQLNDSKMKEYWRTIHLGINGSIGVIHNFENNTSTIKFAPRTFATLERIGCLDRFYFCLKNRSKYLTETEISKIKHQQNELFSLIKSES